MLGIIDNKEQKYQVGDSVKIRLMTSSATADATIKELRSTSEDGKFMVVLYSDTLTSDFVQNRTENVEMVLANMRASRCREMRSGSRMWKKQSQTKRREKRKANRQLPWCLCTGRRKIEFRRLDVVYEGNDYVLSKLNAGDGYLMLYDSIIVEGIDANGN